MRAPSGVRLMVVESGARLPDASACGAPSDTVVLQERAGHASELADALTRHIARAERAGRQIEEAMILVANDNHAVSRRTRLLLARELVAHQIRSGGGEMLFWAAGHAADGARHELLALAGTLTSELGTSPVSIRVLFGERRSAMPAI